MNVPLGISTSFIPMLLVSSLGGWAFTGVLTENRPPYSTSKSVMVSFGIFETFPARRCEPSILQNTR
jgi:hypothetical protein